MLPYNFVPTAPTPHVTILRENPTLCPSLQIQLDDLALPHADLAPTLVKSSRDRKVFGRAEGCFVHYFDNTQNSCSLVDMTALLRQ